MVNRCECQPVPRRRNVLTALLLAATALMVFAAPSAAGDGPIQAQPKMGEPLLGLNQGQLNRFLVGKDAFTRVLLVEEGRGPVFNQDSCASCHNNPIGGSGGQTVFRFGTTTKGGGFDPLADLGGSLLQALAIEDACAEEIPPEATIIAERLTPSTLGLGLVEAIPDADLLANETNPPVNPVSGVAEVSGRAHIVEAFEAPGVPRVGRMGWKAQVPTLLTFTADAANNEMGLTNRFLPNEQDPNGINPPDLADCDSVPDDPYEDNVSLGNGTNREFIDVVTDFQRFLAPPPQTPKSGMTGEAIFVNIGCGDCHRPQFTTADGPPLEPALRNQEIHPYSDYLLHDMGLLGDGIVQGDASGLEMRTMPLRGLRVRDPLVHDARVAGGFFEDRITAAVEWHAVFGSEARPAALRFLHGLPGTIGAPGTPETYEADLGGLDDDDRAAVVTFLDSLGRAEFDHDGDNDRDAADFIDFLACSLIDAFITPDDACAVHDVDQDGDVDADDLNVLVAVYEGQADCNDNHIHDLVEIFNGDSADVNANGIPDECEDCSEDVNGDGVINVIDLVLVITNFGSTNPDPPAADVNGDGIVNVVDLLAVLTNFGFLCG